MSLQEPTPLSCCNIELWHDERQNWANMLFEPGSVPSGPPLMTGKALILVDFQNDFVQPDGNLSVSNVRPFLPGLLSLVEEFRAKGEVIWVHTEYKHSRITISPTTGSHSILLKQDLQEKDLNEESSEYYDDPGNVRSPREDPLTPSPQPDLIHDREAFLAPVITTTKHRCCMPGSWGAEYPEDIKSAIDPQRDMLIEKSHYSAFEDTPLLTHLRTHMITEIYVCGTLSNVAVYASVLDAVCHGVQVTLVEDCLGYLEDACHLEAMRQMADNMGANGVDCQELRDDVAGLLGDIVREEDFPTQFQVSLPPPARKTKSHTSRAQISDWISALDGDDRSTRPPSVVGTESKQNEDRRSRALEANTSSDSSQTPVEHKSIEPGPPRKRSTSNLAPLDQGHSPKSSQKSSPPRTSTHAEQSSPGPLQQSTRKRRTSRDSLNRVPTKLQIYRTRSAEEPSVLKPMSPQRELLPRDDVPVAISGSQHATPKKKKRTPPNILRPEDKMGEGDTRLCIELFDRTEAEQAFYACKTDIRWQKMFHRSGEVPRLVAVQGDIQLDGVEAPIYRHPADESPELLPFDSVVNMLRKAAEKVVGHPLNHALIQWYRDSEDNISEHSDKTLDVVRGSSIVNVSLGAQRTMILRAKKSALAIAVDGTEPEAARPSQRVPLPHNSLFVLGQNTNQHWLHSIRADKRPSFEKTPAELAFEGERISLTFRHIGTFINLADNTIWGQGATSKTRENAQPLITGVEAEIEGEHMIRAFGQENHQSLNWNWEEWYGRGFDVVNFETKPVGLQDGPDMSAGGMSDQVGRSKAEKRKLEFEDDENPSRAGSAPF